MPSVDIETPPMPDPTIEALQIELTQLASGVRRVQGKLRQVVLAADERTRLLQSKVEELETQNLARALEIRDLEAQNAELHQVMEAKKPDLTKAIEERNDAMRQLQHAHKMIEDLLGSSQKTNQGHPTEPLSVPYESISSARPPRNGGKHPKREIPAAVDLDTVESDDGSTIRPPRAVVSIATAPNPPPSKRTAGGRPHSVPMSSALSGSSTAVTSEERSSSEGHGPSSIAKGKKPADWFIGFDHSPGAAEIAEGPIPFARLLENLVLDEDTSLEIAQMDQKSGFDTRIVTEGNVAFAYRPIILESPENTYTIGWGNASMVRNVEKWVKEPREFHLFIYPTMETSGWFYIGMHTLSYAPMETVWSKIGKKDRKRLLVELEERNPDVDVSEQFKKELKSGKLLQCCIQLESREKKTDSLAFMRDLELLKGDARIVEI